MAGKLPKKAEKNKGRSHFQTVQAWIAADPTDGRRTSKVFVNVTTYDNRLYQRAGKNARSRKARELERTFGIDLSGYGKGRRTSKQRSFSSTGCYIG